MSCKALIRAAILLFALSLRADNAKIEIIKDSGAFVVCRENIGNEVTIPKRPQQVVICYGSLIGVWYCAGGKAIAIPKISSIGTLPEAARSLPSVGSFNNPDLEKLLLLRPDLVLLVEQQEKHLAVREILNENKIPSLMVSYENYRDFTRLLDVFCRINGTPIAASPEAVKVTTQVNAITERAQKLPHPRFLTLFTGRGVVAETSNGNTSQMATMLGGENIVTATAGSSVKFSMEQVMLADPDLILIVTMGDQMKIKEQLRKEIMQDELWGKLRSVKAGRVYFLPNELFLYKANERFPEAFRMLAAMMYPQEKWE